jgi:hypothetical protein
VGGGGPGGQDCAQVRHPPCCAVESAVVFTASCAVCGTSHLSVPVLTVVTARIGWLDVTVVVTALYDVLWENLNIIAHDRRPPASCAHHRWQSEGPRFDSEAIGEPRSASPHAIARADTNLAVLNSAVKEPT